MKGIKKISVVSENGIIKSYKLIINETPIENLTFIAINEDHNYIKSLDIDADGDQDLLYEYEETYYYGWDEYLTWVEIGIREDWIGNSGNCTFDLYDIKTKNVTTNFFYIYHQNDSITEMFRHYYDYLSDYQYIICENWDATTSRWQEIPDREYPSSMYSLDYDKDGDMDLVTELFVLQLLNDDTCEYKPLSTDYTLTELKIGNVDGDEYDDFVGLSGNTLVVYYNSVEQLLKEEILLNFTGDIKEFELTDFNGDGHLDIVIKDERNEVFIYQGSSNMIFTLSHTYSYGFENNLLIVDFDNDGDKDFICPPYNWLENENDGTLELHYLPTFNNVTDLDNDGVFDLLAYGGWYKMKL